MAIGDHDTARDSREIGAREIALMLNQQVRSLAPVLLPAGFVSGGMFHVGSVDGEAGDSLKIKLNGPDAGAWADYSCDRSDLRGTGDMLKLVQLTVGEGEIGKAVRWAKGWLGIESMDPAALDRQRKRADAAQQRAEVERAGEIEKSQLKARNLWLNAAPILGTPAQRYLEGRAIDFARIGRIPRAMRFRHDVWQPDLARPCPALLTAGIRGKVHVATHCIFLHRSSDGSWGKLPDITVEAKRHKIAKKVFGKDYYGAHFPVHKGSFGGRHGKGLADMAAGEPVDVAEGLEDALTCAMVFPERRVVMAAVLGNIGALEVPPQCGDFVILAQRDAPGSKAAASLEKQIAVQQRRAAAQGSPRRVLCRWPGERFKDFNDELRGSEFRMSEGAGPKGDGPEGDQD